MRKFQFVKFCEKKTVWKGLIFYACSMQRNIIKIIGVVVLFFLCIGAVKGEKVLC